MLIQREFYVMDHLFILDFKRFTNDLAISCVVEKNLFFFQDSSLLIVLRALNGEQMLEKKDFLFKEKVKKEIIIDQDLWFNRKEIIIGRLKSLLGLGKRVFARKCILKKIDSSQAIEFFDSNHLLGGAKCKFNYGLYYNSELIAAAAFSSPRQMKRGEENVWSFEWVRYAPLIGYNVVGGISRLLEYFKSSENPQEIMSYASKDWSEGDVYRKLGFLLVEETKPIKFYINSRTFERISEKQKERLQLSNPSILCENKDQFIELFNNGNLKFLLRIF